MPSYLLIFIATFASVLAIGVEMRAIARRQILIAVLSSMVVAVGQLVALRLVPQTIGISDYLSYILANALGILVSFNFHALISRGDAHDSCDPPARDGHCPAGDACGCHGDPSSCVMAEMVREYVARRGEPPAGVDGDVATPPVSPAVPVVIPGVSEPRA